MIKLNYDKNRYICILVSILLLITLISFINNSEVEINVGTNNTTCKLDGASNLDSEFRVNKLINTKNFLDEKEINDIINVNQKRKFGKREIIRKINKNDLLFLQNCQQLSYYQASKQSQLEFDNIYNIKNEKGISEQFQKLIEKFNSTVLDENWLFSDGSIKPLYVDINWNIILQLFSNNDYNQNSEIELKKQILSFFNIIFHYYGEENILKLLFTLTQVPNFEENNIVAVTGSYSTVNLAYMSFGKKFVNVNEQYESGFWSSNNASTVLVHEYGHALESFLSKLPEVRSSYNNFLFSNNNFNAIKKILRNNNNLQSWNAKYNNELINLNRNRSNIISLNKINTKFFDPSLELIEFLANKFNIKDQQQKYLLAWSLINSRYGRYGGKKELFAEAFSQWIGSSFKNKRTKNWELLHQFFTQYLPTVSKIKI